MFKSKSGMAKKNSDVDLGSRNHIAQGTKINGDILTEGDIRIDGQLEGSVQSQGKVVVGHTGNIKGEVKCQTANISGRVSGKLNAAEMVSFQESGVFSGEMVYGKLSVDPGATLEGTFTIAGKVKDLNSNDKQKGQGKKTG